MFSLIESKNEIERAQKKLETTINKELKSRVVKNIGYPSGTILDAAVNTDKKYWYWSADLRDPNVINPRRLNLFGLFGEGATLQISVEINIAYEGRNDQVAGFFARNNENGVIYLMHSGRVGGGTAGIGKKAFLAWSNLRTVEVVDSSGGIKGGVVVMPIEGVAATRSVFWYINTVADFKHAVRAGDTDSPAFQSKKREYEDFFAEPRGRRKGRRSREIDYLSRHGEVVDALYSWRRSKDFPRNGRLVKNVLIDMGVQVGDKLVEVFEVKTSVGRSDIYSAIGQLMVHGKLTKCKRVIVLPDNEVMAVDLMEALQRLNIEFLWFKLDEKATIL